MIGRLLVLLRKELAQHALVVVGLALLLGLLGLVQWAAVSMDAQETSQLAAAGKTLLVFTPIAALVLGHYVVVREYHGRAQLFLETLPLRRWEFVIAKLAFGYAVLAVLTIALVLVMARAAEHVDRRHLAIVAIRVIGYAAACWTVFFTFGLLGRLRMPLYVAAAIALFVLERASGFEIERFGPLALVDSTLVYERERLPARQLAHTALLSCAFLGVALGLSLIREGSVAEVLARRASQREKSAFVVFLAVAMMVAGTATEKQQAKPFEFTSPHVRKSARADVSIMYGWPELEPSAATLLLALERASSRFEEELGFVGRPPIRVAHQSTLPARESRQQALPDADGVLIETNLAPESLDAAEVLYTAAHASFIWTTGGRASLEPEHWFLDGFSAWWVAEQLPAERERLWLRGLVVAQHGSIVPATVAGWEQLMQTEGEAMVNGLAFTAVASLVERYGRAVVIELGRKRLVAPSRNGLWAFLRAEPLSEQVTRLTGIGWADFVTAWRDDLLRKSSQGSLSHRLRALPRLEARLSIEASATGPRIVYELTGEPPIAPRDCALLHTVTKPYDVFVASEQMQREAATWPAGKAKLTGDLRGQYGSGQRVFLAVECYLPELGASRRLKALRATLP